MCFTQRNIHWNVCLFKIVFSPNVSLLHFCVNMSVYLLKILCKFCILRNNINYINSYF